MPAQDPYRVPERLRARFDQIVARTDALATEHLNGEYADLARRMAAALARKRPSPLESGQPRTWAAAILYAVGWVNFLSDPSQDPHMTTAELAEKAGVGESTIAAQFRKIRDALKLVRLEPEWTLPGRLADNPLVWLLMVDGIPTDVRHEPREFQEAVFKAGLIPFIPADRAPRPEQEPGTAKADEQPGTGGRKRTEGRGPRPGGGRQEVPAGAELVYRIKITLEDVRPAIWRRVLVPADSTLAGLHRVVQAAMGWKDYHLWRFEIGGVEYGEPLEEDWNPPSESARATRLDQVAGPRDILLYEYDFGDGWEHSVKVEKVLPAEPGLEYPVCVAAERAGPPEDSGGPLGYERLLEVLADPADPELGDMLAWVGEAFDAEAVDLDEINRRLALTRPRESEGGWAPQPASEARQGAGGGRDSGLVSIQHQAEAMLRQAGEVLEQILADNPDASFEELNAALQSAGFNVAPQPETGGLAFSDVQRLVDANWEGQESAIRLNETLSLDDLASSRTLGNARLVLEMLGEEGEVKATPKGNLPRAFVTRFRDHMGAPARSGDAWLPERKTVNEEDVAPLHLTRILLDLGGLVKRRKGIFSLTRAGERLAPAGRAGELFAALFRVHFRRFNLGYLDGAEDLPGFQFSTGFSLFRFGQLGGDWKRPDELAESIVLPGVGDDLPPNPFFDPLPLIVETRFLRPLEGFGLAEMRELPRVPGELRPNRSYRKAPLYDRFLRFVLPRG